MNKNLLLLVCLFVLTTKSMQAQKFAIGGKLGVDLLIGDPTNVALPFIVNPEFAFRSDMSVALDIGYEVGPGKKFSIFSFSPEYRYHFNRAFNGFYIGPYIVAGKTNFSGNYVSLGGSLGYQIMVRSHFNIDIHTQTGFGSAGRRNTTRTNGVHFRPAVGLRYAF